MRAFLMTIMLTSISGVSAQDVFISKPGSHARRMENPLYSDYYHRMRGRRSNALYLRREINMRKPPARGWTALSVPYNPLFGAQGRSFIELGWVRQPPIPAPSGHRAYGFSVPRSYYGGY